MLNIAFNFGEASQAKLRGLKKLQGAEDFRALQGKNVQLFLMLKSWFEAFKKVILYKYLFK